MDYAASEIEYSRKMKKEKGLSALMLSDPEEETAGRYGLRYKLPQDLKNVYRQFDNPSARRLRPVEGALHFSDSKRASLNFFSKTSNRIH
ncbi:MAG: hypothetical protein WBY88_16230 [Desulfosarcina sp.]